MRPAMLGVTIGLGACFFEPSRPAANHSDAAMPDSPGSSSGGSNACTMPTIAEDFGSDGSGCGRYFDSAYGNVTRSGGLLHLAPSGSDSALVGCTKDPFSFSHSVVFKLAQTLPWRTAVDTTAYTLFEMDDESSNKAMKVEIESNQNGASITAYDDMSNAIGSQWLWTEGAWVRLTPVDAHTISADWSADGTTWMPLGSVQLTGSTSTVALIAGAGEGGGTTSNPGEALIDSFDVCP